MIKTGNTSEMSDSFYQVNAGSASPGVTLRLSNTQAMDSELLLSTNSTDYEVKVNEKRTRADQENYEDQSLCFFCCF